MGYSAQLFFSMCSTALLKSLPWNFVPFKAYRTAPIFRRFNGIKPNLSMNSDSWNFVIWRFFTLGYTLGLLVTLMFLSLLLTSSPSFYSLFLRLSLLCAVGTVAWIISLHLNQIFWNQFFTSFDRFNGSHKFCLTQIHCKLLNWTERLCVCVACIETCILMDSHLKTDHAKPH